MGFVLGETEETVWRWLARAAPTAYAMTAHLWRDLPVTQGPRDEMWTWGRRQPVQQANTDGASTAWSAAVRGLWTFARAWQLLQMTAAVVLGGPGVFRAGVSGALAALGAVYHPVQPVPRPGQAGRSRKPVQAASPELA